MSTPPSGARNSYPGSPFVGRKRERSALRDELANTIAGHGRIVLVSGEPGIGKTRLAGWLASEAQETGTIISWGYCYEGEGAPAFWPWLQILRSCLPLNDAEALWTDTGADAARLAQIVPEIEQVFPDLDPLPAMNPEQARFRLFDAVARLLKRRADEQPRLVILEDLHWADTPSLLLLQFLARELRSSRLLVLGTYRNVEVQRQHPLSATLASLVREPVAQRIPLHRFTPEEVGDLIEQISETTPAELAQAVWRETEGNPFFVTEVIRLLESEARPQRSVGRLSEFRIPESIREVIGQRLDRHSPECNELLAVAAVTGREFDLPILESVTGKQAIDLLALLDEASQSQIIEPVDGFGQYRFSHRLIQETLYDELSSSQRFRLHAQTGAALEERYAGDLREHYGTLAHHYARAPFGANIEKAIDYATKAAKQALRQVAWEEAVTSYELALQVLELHAGPTPTRRCDLLLALGSAKDMAGSGRGGAPGTVHASDARSTYWQAVNAAQAGGSIDHLARAAIGLAYGFFAGVPSTDQRVVRLLEEILARLSDEITAEQALLQANLAAAYRNFKMYSGVRFEAGTETVIEQLSAEAIEIADRGNDPSMMANSRLARHTAISHPGRAGELRSLIDELLSMAVPATIQQYDTQTAIFHVAFRTCMAHGDVAAGKQLINRMITHHAETKARISSWSALVFRAGLALSEGQYEDSEALLTEADAIWPNTGIVCNQTFALCREQDRLGNVEGRLQPIHQRFPESPWFRMLSILYLLETGEEAEARQRFNAVDVHDLADLARGDLWTHVLALCAELSVELESEKRARICYELLEPFPDHVIYCGYIYYCAGSVSHYLGLLAGFLEEWWKAEAYFEQALEQHRSMGFRPLVAYTQLEWARMLVKRGLPGDLERASELLDQSFATAHRLGMGRLQRLASELMADVHPEKGVSVAGLSPRETEVIDLVVAGMSNPEIGEALYISPRTVSQHLRSVFNKLDVNNRAAAVARWIELSRD